MQSCLLLILIWLMWMNVLFFFFFCSPPVCESRCAWSWGWSVEEKKVDGSWMHAFESKREEDTVMHGSADTAAVTLRLFLTLPVGSWLMRTDSTVSRPNVIVKQSRVAHLYSPSWSNILKLFESWKDASVCFEMRGGCWRNDLVQDCACLSWSRNLSQCCGAWESEARWV